MKTCFGRCEWVILSKSVCNKFRTVQNKFVNMFCKAIPDIVPSRQARSRRRKSIENSIKTCSGRCKWVLFSKSLSNNQNCAQRFC